MSELNVQVGSICLISIGDAFPVTHLVFSVSDSNASSLVITLSKSLCLNMDSKTRLKYKAVLTYCTVTVVRFGHLREYPEKIATLTYALSYSTN